MKDVLEDFIENDIPVIDNTKTEEYYLRERLRRDEENVAKHMFVQNTELGIGDRRVPGRLRRSK